MIIRNIKDRFERTNSFLEKSIKKESVILDLGVQNDLSRYLIEKGYQISNTSGQDLDLDFEIVKKTEFDVVTAFEIFEHMFCPFQVLRHIHAKTLIASVPLKLWFANAYWNDNDDRDKHYHEFEIKQFNLLLNKTGWKIIYSEKWKSAGNLFGIRPILRLFSDRYYIVHCERL